MASIIENLLRMTTMMMIMIIVITNNIIILYSILYVIQRHKLFKFYYTISEKVLSHHIDEAFYSC